MNADAKISVQAIFPVLDSIVDADASGSSLKMLLFPSKWHRVELDRSDDAALVRFLANYNRLLDSRPFNCAGCLS